MNWIILQDVLEITMSAIHHLYIELKISLHLQSYPKPTLEFLVPLEIKSRVLPYSNVLFSLKNKSTQFGGEGWALPTPVSICPFVYRGKG